MRATTRCWAVAVASVLVASSMCSVAANASALGNPSTAAWSWGRNSVGMLGDPSVPGDAVSSPHLVTSPVSWSSVAASKGGNFTVGVKTDGSLWSWGDNSSGQLGDGTTNARSTPARIGSDSNWKAVAVGVHFVIALKVDGSLWSWGNNSDGELGDGSIAPSAEPHVVAGISGVSHIAAGAASAMAIGADGTLWAWGDNSAGQLGDGSTNDALAPQKVGLETSWSAIALASFTALALRGDGTLWSWGAPLGTFSANQTSPQRVGNDSDWAKISGGNSFALALKTNGTIWAWGNNSAGQLGDGTFTSRSAPHQVGSDTTWNTVFAGGMFASSTKSDGTLWTWGENSYGQLGYGIITQEQLTPKQAGAETTWATGSGGLDSIAMLQSDGTLWVWGNNTDVVLGIGAGRASPGPVMTPGPWASLSTSGDHALAIKSDGTLWGWGSNVTGSIVHFPQSEIGPLQIGLANDWQSVALGARHALAIKSDGSLWSWGQNSDGQLGDGSTLPSANPERLGVATDWAGVASGDNFSVALKNGGTLWAWGSNRRGQLANAQLPFGTLQPTQIGTDSDWSAISAGSEFVVARKVDGTLWSWGDNDNGQLGDGSRNARPTPSQVAPGTQWLSLAAGPQDAAAIRTDGTLWTWGDNAFGQLGEGTTSDRLAPVQVGAGGTWSSVRAGTSHMLATRTDKTLWTWGDNSRGQLGDGSTATRTAPEQIGSATNWSGIAAGDRFSIALTDGTAPPPPDAPTNVAASAGNGSATVTWNPVDGHGTPILSYTVTATPGGAEKAVVGGNTTATVTDLAVGTAYTFTVRAANSGGSSAESTASNSVVPTGPPDVVATVSAVAGDASALVSWAAPNDHGSAILSYTVYTFPGGSQTTVAGAQTGVLILGLTNDHEYAFRVRATNANGQGPQSASSNVVVPKGIVVDQSSPIVAMSAPSSVVRLSTSIPVQWSGSDPSGIDHFDVQRRVAPWDGPFEAWSAFLAPTTATSESASGTYGHTYCFEARAQDSVLNLSGWSSERCTAIPLRSDQLAHSASWTKTRRTGAFAGFGYLTSKHAASMSRTRVVGKRLYLVATKCPTCGSITARWNGTTIKSVSLYNVATRRAQVILLAQFSRAHSGTLTITVTSASGKSVFVEGLAVYNS